MMYVHIINQNNGVLGVYMQTEGQIQIQYLSRYGQWALFVCSLYGISCLQHLTSLFLPLHGIRLNKVRGSSWGQLQCCDVAASQRSVWVKVSQVSRVSWDQCVNESGFHGNYTTVSTFGWQTIGSLIGFAPNSRELTTEKYYKMHCDMLSEKSIHNDERRYGNAEKCCLSVCRTALSDYLELAT